MLNMFLKIYCMLKEKKALVIIFIVFFLKQYKSKFCGNCICNTHGKYRHANP